MRYLKLFESQNNSVKILPKSTNPIQAFKLVKFSDNDPVKEFAFDYFKEFNIEFGQKEELIRIVTLPLMDNYSELRNRKVIKIVIYSIEDEYYAISIFNEYREKETKYLIDGTFEALEFLKNFVSENSEVFEAYKDVYKKYNAYLESIRDTFQKFTIQKIENIIEK